MFVPESRASRLYWDDPDQDTGRSADVEDMLKCAEIWVPASSRATARGRGRGDVKVTWQNGNAGVPLRLSHPPSHRVHLLSIHRRSLSKANQRAAARPHGRLCGGAAGGV